MARARRTSCSVNGRLVGTCSTCREPNQRMRRTDGSLVGSIARRPSDDNDGIGSISNVARPKNCRNAACSRLSYRALAAKSGGSDMYFHHNSIIRHMARRTLLDFFADLSVTDGEFIVFDDGYRTWSYSYR